MIISLEYSYKMFIVDKIYETINDPDIAIRIELVDFVVHVDETDEKRPKFVDWKNYVYFNAINEYTKRFYSTEHENKCDHVIWVEGYPQDNSIYGEAHVGEVCGHDHNMYASHVRHTKFGELTISHEMGHNLGSNHDEARYCDSIEIKRVMWPSLIFNYRAHTFSKCSVKQFVKMLLDPNTKMLKDEFKCLEKKNFERVQSFYRYLI